MKLKNLLDVSATHYSYHALQTVSSLQFVGTIYNSSGLRNDHCTYKFEAIPITVGS